MTPGSHSSILTHLVHRLTRLCWRCALVAVLMMAGAQTANAQFWIGGTGTQEWNNEANWDDFVPGAYGTTTNNDVALFNPAAGATTITIDRDASAPVGVNDWRNIEGMIFFEGAGGAGYTFGSAGPNAGNSLHLTSAGSIFMQLGNTSSVTINAPLVVEALSPVLSGTYTFDNSSTNVPTTSGPPATSDVNPYKMIINGDISGGQTSQSITLDFRATTGNRSNDSTANIVNGRISDGLAAGGVSVNIVGSAGGNQGVWRFNNNANSYTGNTSVTAGTFIFTSIADAGVASAIGAGNALTIAGGAHVKYNGGAATTNRTISGSGLLYNQGTGALTLTGSVTTGITFRGGQNFIIEGLISGSSGLSRTDGGTVFLRNDNNAFTGNLSISDGAFSIGTISNSGVGAVSAIGTSGNITFGQNSSTIGRLEYTGMTASTDRVIQMNNTGAGNSGRGLIDMQTAGETLTFTGPVRVASTAIGNISDLDLRGVGNGVISGRIGGTAANAELAGSLRILKNGAGTWTLSGANTYARDTQINAGILNVQNSRALGATMSNEAVPTSAGAGTTIANGATLQLQGNIAIGAEALTLRGTGAAGQTGALVNVSGTNTFGGALTLTDSATISSDSGMLDLTNTAAIVGSGGNRALTLAGAGNGRLASNMTTAVSSLTKNGTGIWTLGGTSSYTGATTINGGVLNVTGALGTTAVAVNSGATLAGTGPAGGAVTVANGGTLSAGDAMIPGSTGTLTLGSLLLNDTSQLNFDLGTASDRIAVTGALTLDGVVNVVAGAGFGGGIYDIMTYGTLTANNGLQLGAVASGFNYVIDTDTAGFVKLVVDQTGLLFWDGGDVVADGVVDGGNGVWNNTTTNWTSGDGTVNSGWDDQTAVFAGAAGGTVGIADTVAVAGLQFARNYTLADQGAGVGQISLAGAASEIRVDPSVTATISAAIVGAGGINKTNTGTLVLSGTNTYGGPTRISQGTLVVGAENTLPTTGAVIIGSGNSLTGHLDVSSHSQQIGSLQFDSDIVGTANLVTIGAGQTLTVSGAGGLKVGAANLVPNTTRTTLATMTGGGTLLVNNTGAIIDVGIPTTLADTTAARSVAIMDLTGLGMVRTDVSQIRVGFGLYNTGTLLLSDTANELTAGSFQIGNSGGMNAGTLSTMVLGAGTNVLTGNILNIGTSKGLGSVRFASSAPGSAGTVVIQGKTAAGIAINVGSGETGTASTPNGLLDLRGHVATVTASTLIIGKRFASGGGGATGVVHFDGGTFTATNVDIGNMSLEGGGNASGTLNISGGTFTVNPGGSFTMATYANTVLGSTTGLLNITGGALISNVDILEGGGVNSTTTNTVSTITLNGGTLDMTGHNIGSATNTINVINLQSGTLKDVAEINGGAAITKTTAGTLIMAGNNAYTGTTTVSAGTLLANNDIYSDLNSATGSNAVTVNSAAVLGGNGHLAGDVTLNSGATLAPGGNATSIAANVSGLNTDVGTLRISGALTVNAGSNLALQLKTGGQHGLNTTFDPTTGMLLSVSGESQDGGNDRIITVGTLSLDLGSTTTVTFGEGYIPSGFDVFDLLDWTILMGTAALDNMIRLEYYGDASGRRQGGAGEDYALELPDLSSFGSEWFWDVSQFGATGVVSIVPEPGRAMLLFIGLTGLFLRRRRRA